jgi:hypothetical protein
MKIEIGSYVRIVSDYPANRNLQDQTGSVEALPNKEHRNEYLVKLDGRNSLSPYLVGMLVWVPANSLEMAGQILG